MARRIAAGNDVSDLDLNMTPMIDIIFQLIIFLMVANDLSRKEIEELRLPEVTRGVEDPSAPDRLIVNLVKGEAGRPPSLHVRGRPLDLPAFRQVLADASRRAGREEDGSGASRLSVLIRADRETRWQDVQFVMQACADPLLRVYRIQFATTDPAGRGLNSMVK